MAAKILSISANDALRLTRQLLLENAGYEVLSASSNLREVRAAARKLGKCDLVIIGHSLVPRVKRSLAEVIRNVQPACPILELCLASPNIQDAEFHLRGAEPEELLSTIHLILDKKARRSRSA